MKKKIVQVSREHFKEKISVFEIMINLVIKLFVVFRDVWIFTIFERKSIFTFLYVTWCEIIFGKKKLKNTKIKVSTFKMRPTEFSLTKLQQFKLLINNFSLLLLYLLEINIKLG